MNYIFNEKSKKSPVLILFHGTGGDETDLLSVGNFLRPDSSILSLRGEVNESGMLRFFKRKSEGIFDTEDLNYRGEKITDFLRRLAQKYDFDLSEVVLVGFSNGANMIINLLLRSDTPFHRGILFSPMYPIEVDTQNLSAIKVFISTGRHDPIIPTTESNSVVDIFRNNKAQVEHFWVDGHEINYEALIRAKKFIDDLE